MARRPRKRRTAREAADTGPARHPARIYREIHVDGHRFWALFDSGARSTYAARAAAALMGAKPLTQPVRRGLGGRFHRITHYCSFAGLVDSHGLTTTALVVNTLFRDETGRPIDILVGMETMESWGIGLDTARKRLDFSRYAREAHEL